MLGKNEKAFDQRKDQNSAHNECDVRNELSNGGGHEHQRQKRYHCCGHGEKDGRCDAFRSAFGGLFGIFFAALDGCVDIFPHNDCVIDHDTNRENEGEDRQLVDRDACHLHRDESTDKADGHADTDPESDPDVEKQ